MVDTEFIYCPLVSEKHKISTYLGTVVVFVVCMNEVDNFSRRIVHVEYWRVSVQTSSMKLVTVLQHKSVELCLHIGLSLVF